MKTTECQDLLTRISAIIKVDLKAGYTEKRDGSYEYYLFPTQYSRYYTFGIEITIAKQRLEVAFRPGNFSRELLHSMSRAGIYQKKAFCAILQSCIECGGQIEMRVNGVDRKLDDEDVWMRDWFRFSLVLSKGQLDIGNHNQKVDIAISIPWIERFAGAVVAILPFQNGKLIVETAD